MKAGAGESAKSGDRDCRKEMWESSQVNLTRLE